MISVTRMMAVGRVGSTSRLRRAGGSIGVWMFGGRGFRLVVGLGGDDLDDFGDWGWGVEG